ncbi:MAG: hypothetical protein ACRDPH_11435, partial [Marmoricola sp.]
MTCPTPVLMFSWVYLMWWARSGRARPQPSVVSAGALASGAASTGVSAGVSAGALASGAASTGVSAGVSAGALASGAA